MIIIKPENHPPYADNTNTRPETTLVGTANPRPATTQATTAALRLLATRPRTIAEIRQRLTPRFGTEAAEKTISRLQSQGLLNDADFAQQWRNARERRKPRSPAMIAQELRAKGIADEIITQTLDGYDAPAAAHRAAARYAARQAHNNRATFDRRVTAYLHRRGFNSEITRQTLQQLRQELNITRSDTPED